MLESIGVADNTGLPVPADARSSRGKEEAGTGLDADEDDEDDKSDELNVDLMADATADAADKISRDRGIAGDLSGKLTCDIERAALVFVTICRFSPA